MEHKLEWQPGQYGKGLVHPDGSVQHWNTSDAHGGPHHAEALGLGIEDTVQTQRNYHAFTVGPDGTIDFAPLTEERGDHVVGVDPRLKWNNDHWKFTKAAGLTNPQRQRAVMQEDERWQDRSKVEHEFPNGWTIRHLQTSGDKNREGRLMRNCWQQQWSYDNLNLPSWVDKTGPVEDELPIQHYWAAGMGENMKDHHQMYSLRDENNYPHVSFYVSGGQLGNALGHRNTPIKGDHAQMLDEFAKAKGIPNGLKTASYSSADWQPGTHGKGFLLKDGNLHTWNVADNDADGEPAHHEYFIENLHPTDLPTDDPYVNKSFNDMVDEAFWLDPQGKVETTGAEPNPKLEQAMAKHHPEATFGYHQWQLGKVASSAFATELRLFLDGVHNQLSAKEGPTPHHDGDHHFTQPQPGILARIRTKFRTSDLDTCPRCGEPTVGSPCDVCGYSDGTDYEAQKEDWYGDRPAGWPTKFPYTAEPWRTEHHAPTVGLASTQSHADRDDLSVHLPEPSYNVPVLWSPEKTSDNRPTAKVPVSSGRTAVDRAQEGDGDAGRHGPAVPRVIWQGDGQTLGDDHSILYHPGRNEIHIGSPELHHSDLLYHLTGRMDQFGEYEPYWIDADGVQADDPNRGYNAAPLISQALGLDNQWKF